MTSSSTALHSLLVMLVVAPRAGEELISSSHGLGTCHVSRVNYIVRFHVSIVRCHVSIVRFHVSPEVRGEHEVRPVQLVAVLAGAAAVHHVCCMGI